MDSTLKETFNIINNLKNLKPKEYVPPITGSKPNTEMVLDKSFVVNTRGYIERVVDQINGSYEKGWYDACAVMIRRIVETLIIECFEHFNLSNKIKDTNGDFYFLSNLINLILIESSWTISRNSKESLKKIKKIGDLSSHNRRFIAHRTDIENIIQDFRIVVQELLFLSGIK